MNNSFVTCFDKISTIPDTVDALFVINQDVTPEQISSIVGSHKLERLIIVSTHAPFPSEHNNFVTLLEPARVWWFPMSWLLSDTEMEGCDDRAVAELAVDSTGRIDMGVFLKRSRFLRNELAASNLTQHSHWNSCYATEGIGVVGKAWPSSIPLSTLQQPIELQRSLLKRLMDRFARMRSIPKIQVVENESEFYAFLGSIHRLRFRSDVRIRELKASLWSLFRLESKIFTLKRLVKRAASESAGKSFVVATTVHNFSPWMLEAFPDLRVFVDGLHSPNYPISYGAAYRGAVVVSREDCDRLWFEKCGCTVLPPPQILVPELNYGDPCSTGAIRNICLILNHAGDWSAIIDRSDTDLAVMAFAAAAAKAPQFNFRIRLHPTMAMLEHEGVNSCERIIRWIKNLNLPNMELSTSTLDEDITWTDCCISEYSNVLVDCMKAGKTCIALNTTNRRNLLEHLEPLGLRTVHNGDEIVDLLIELSM